MKRMLHLSLLFFLSLGLALSTAPNASAAQSPQIPLNPKTIPQFVDALPLVETILPSGTATVPPYGPATVPQDITLFMNEFQSQVLSTGTPLPGLGAAVTVQPLVPATHTYVWGYQQTATASPRASYLGPVVLATRGIPTKMTYVNNLGNASATNVTFYKYSIDQTLFWADPLSILQANDCVELKADPILGPALGFTNIPGTNRFYPSFGSPCASNYDGPIPAVVHLHGGEVPPLLDGGPDSWFTSTGKKGPGYYTSTVSGDTTPSGGAIYRYPNSQEAANIWFHDHALGITRLNVYAGMAGGYLINDPALVLPTGLRPYGLTSTANDTTLTGDTPIVPLVIQDRMFDTNGQLFFPGDSAGGLLWSTNPDHPYWVPEFVGDTIVVNGKTWPFLSVQAKRYRFLVLNGSNARTYVLDIPGVKGMYVIGTDGGYLDAPVAVKTLTVMPGERYDVIIDFGGLKGNFIMNNSGKTPFPRGAQPAGATVGRVMQFRVTPLAPTVVDNSYNPALGVALRPPMQRLTTGGNPPANAALKRLLTLNEDLALPVAVPADPVTGLPVAYPGGPLEVLVNNTKYAPKLPSTGACRGDFTLKTVGYFDQCYSELPAEGATEVWEIVNLTADAHPMHLHAVQFQIINRQNFDLAKYNAAYNLAFTGTGPGGPLQNCAPGTYCPGYGPPLSYGPTAASGNKYGGNPDVFPYLKQAPVLPALEEQGWKDTVVVMPGMVTRLAVRWAPTELPIATLPANAYFPFNPGLDHGYVWHCHIIDHEDNEMMRPTWIEPNTTAPRTYAKGTNY
jgi:spore coat protein A, manganese oxidase